MASAKISSAQIRKIYAMQRQAGVNGDELHDIVYGLTGCESIKCLSMQQAIRVIDRLNALAGVEKGVPNRTTEAQQLYILRLAKEMGWSGDPNRLRGFLEAKAGVSDVRFLTLDSARRIIEALKAIQKGGRAERPTRGASAAKQDAPRSYDGAAGAAETKGGRAERRRSDERLDE